MEWPSGSTKACRACRICTRNPQIYCPCSELVSWRRRLWVLENELSPSPSFCIRAATLGRERPHLQEEAPQGCYSGTPNRRWKPSTVTLGEMAEGGTEGGSRIFSPTKHSDSSLHCQNWYGHINVTTTWQSHVMWNILQICPRAGFGSGRWTKIYPVMTLHVVQFDIASYTSVVHSLGLPLGPMNLRINDLLLEASWAVASRWAGDHHCFALSPVAQDQAHVNLFTTEWKMPLRGISITWCYWSKSSV